MTTFAISSLLTAILTAALGAFVWLKNPRRKLNKSWLLVSLSVFLWTLGLFGASTTSSAVMAFFWQRILYIGTIFIPLAFFYYCLVLLKIEKKEKIIFYIGAILSIFFVVAIFSPFFLSYIKQKTAYNYWPVQTGFLYWPFLAYFAFYTVYSLIILRKRLGLYTGIYQKQIQFVYYAALVGFLGGSTNFLLDFNLRAYPFGNFFVFLYVLLISYAITRYRLMNVQVIIRRGLIFALGTIAIATFTFLPLYFLAPYLGKQYLLLMSVGLALIDIYIFPYVISGFRRIANNFFFASLYQEEQTLTRLLDEVPTLLSLSQLIELISKTLQKTFHLKKIGILLYDSRTSKYLPHSLIGFHEDNGVSLVRNNFLLDYLRTHQRPLVEPEIHLMLENLPPSTPAKNVSDLEKLQNHLQRIEAVVCCPIIAKGKLIGIIILGEKSSRAPYFKGDLKFLQKLSVKASTPIENAILYAQARYFNATLKKEVKKATTDLRQANVELRQLDQAKTEFLSIASHQLRTPLTAIRGYLSMIEEGDYGSVPQKVKETIKRVYQATTRLIELTNNLLNVTRIETGKISFAPSLVSFSDLISSIVQELKPDAEQKNLFLEYKKSKKKIPRIKIDEEKIRQVILNVLDNAIKYTTKGGITLTLEVIEDEQKLQLKIKDTGEGISASEMDKLFRSFSRGAAGSHLYSAGAGLGLYVARRFVNIHPGGKIWAESPGKGKGSTFCLELSIKETKKKS